MEKREGEVWLHRYIQMINEAPKIAFIRLVEEFRKTGLEGG
jgi:hypothetical protein